MIFYLSVIAIADALLMALNLHFNWLGISALRTVVVLLVQPVALIAIDGGAAWIVRWLLPARWLSYKVRFHRVSAEECRLYERLGIKRWKDKVLELGMFTSFSKKSVVQPENRAYIERFILECNAGAWGHMLGIIGGYLLVCAFPRSYAPCIVIPAATVNAFLSLLPYMILRYNLPRLHRLRDLLEKKEARDAAYRT